MKLFTIIETGFVMGSLFIFYFFIEPRTTLPILATYLLFGSTAVILHQLLIRLKKKFGWMEKTIDTQLGVMLVIAIVLTPIFFELVLFGIGK
ncbi:hypothetical protein D1B31_11480 [Neobacillus notoginsengisoli]|uniref:Uncharacterized protein n=1 Tax=Neobacillus notoginsengisoli TaxID=1578198 RepID=A0A417YUL3_9BACI|nr:hypothetical protein [Neobacillus notoginsengisoli]RHW40802.1 hypothetical protein D1B31_11480 [Neobacillus notoginsengisoli]